MNWNATKKEREIIAKICKRVKAKAEDLDVLALSMDLEATHNDCALDFKKLLAADDFNFWHDISGILGCLDRQTGKLKNHFLPRCAK